MGTIATLNLAPTTDLPQVFECKGANNLQISVSNAGVFLAFAPTTMMGMVGGFGMEEFHAPELIAINGEPIGAIQYRSAVPGTPAVLTIAATT